jgi:hypothetical protein
MILRFRRKRDNFVSFLDGEYFAGRKASLTTFFNDSSFPLPALSHTVSLRLSLDNVTELAMLTQRAALPRVRHLHVTLEGSADDWDSWADRANDWPSARLCPDDLHPSRCDLPQLRTLHLQQVILSDIIVLAEQLPCMTRLESLTIVNSKVKGM